MLNKRKVKDLYLEGYNAVEIAKKLNLNTESVRKCIQRNFSNLKKEHLKSKAEKRDIAKSLNHESSKYMSDRAFILKNRSIYKTLPNGDIVLKKEAYGIVTHDTPRRLVNENKCTYWRNQCNDKKIR